MGGVSVTRGHIGLSLGSDRASFPMGGESGNDNVTSLFPMWTVTFDGDCSFEDDVWTSCPANIGDLEVRRCLVRIGSDEIGGASGAPLYFYGHPVTCPRWRW